MIVLDFKTNFYDRYRDDIADLIVFYRRHGGTGRLAPNPNVPLEQVRNSNLDVNCKDNNDNNAKRPPPKEVLSAGGRVKRTRGKENNDLESAATPIAAPASKVGAPGPK